MAAPPLAGLHHLKVPVTDLDTHLDWYQRVFDASRVPGLDHADSEGTRYAAILEIPGVPVPLELRRAPAAAQVLRECDIYLYAEWNNKAAAFVSYGAMGGARAVERLRRICSELQIAHVRQQVSFNLFTDFENMTTFATAPLHKPLADAMFARLGSWANAMKTVRQPT